MSERGAPLFGPVPRVSVVCCSYNGSEFIEDTIRSVLGQSFEDFELIVFDDCSDDDTVARVCAMNDPRITVHSAEQRLNIGQARSAALSRVRGEWIAFIDQDDLWTEHKLRHQLALVDGGDDDRVGIVYGRTKKFGAVKGTTNFDPWYVRSALPSGDIFAELLARPAFVALSSALIRRIAIEDVGAIPEWVVYCPDYFLFLAIAKRWNVASLEELCCLYRVHDASMSHVYASHIHAEALAIIEALAEPEHAGIVRRRRKIANTLIAIEQLRKHSYTEGFSRLVRDGSLSYFLGRSVYRKVRDIMNSRGEWA